MGINGGKPCPAHFSLKAGFSAPARVDILAQIILCGGADLVPCRMFSSVPGLCPLARTTTTPVVTIQMSPDVAKPGGQKLAPTENPTLTEFSSSL